MNLSENGHNLESDLTVGKHSKVKATNENIANILTQRTTEEVNKATIAELQFELNNVKLETYANNPENIQEQMPNIEAIVMEQHPVKESVPFDPTTDMKLEKDGFTISDTRVSLAA